MKFIMIIPSILLAVSALAKKESHHQHRHQHEAHVHGAAILNIAFDQQIGKLEFKSPAESIVGFEHEAKTPAEIQIKKTAIESFEKNISNYVQFESQLGCTFLKEKIDFEIDSVSKNQNSKNIKGQHSDFIAAFSVKCQNNLTGSKITFNFTEFKKLKEIDATIIVDELQKSIEIKVSELSFELK